MKKFISFVLAISFTLSLCACTHTHNWQEATCTTPQICADCNEKQGSVKEHTWKEATCTAAKMCTVCGIKSGSAKEHTWKEATCTAAKMCTVCGIKSGSAKEHTWKEATCTVAKTCTVCGTKSGSAKGHRYTGINCNVCNKEHPEKNKIFEVLYDSARWVSYISIDGVVLESAIKLYKLTGSVSDFRTVQETVTEIDEYYAKIRNECYKYKDNELAFLYILCDRERPVVTSSNMSTISLYAASAKDLANNFLSICEAWGFTAE